MLGHVGKINLVSLALVTCGGGKTPTTRTTTPAPVPETTPVATGDTALRDTAWWRDTGPTTTAPDCPGLVGARVCAGSITSTGSGDSGGSGAASDAWCPETMLLFSSTGQARLMLFDSTCAFTEEVLDWVCVGANELTLGADPATWDDAAGSLDTVGWGTLTEAACQAP